MIYLTGDIHGNPMQVELFCSKMQLAEDDIIIMLGDVGGIFMITGELQYDLCNVRYPR